MMLPAESADPGAVPLRWQAHARSILATAIAVLVAVPLAVQDVWPSFRIGGSGIVSLKQDCGRPITGLLRDEAWRDPDS